MRPNSEPDLAVRVTDAQVDAAETAYVAAFRGSDVLVEHPDVWRRRCWRTALEAGICACLADGTLVLGTARSTIERGEPNP